LLPWLNLRLYSFFFSLLLHSADIQFDHSGSGSPPQPKLPALSKVTHSDEEGSVFYLYLPKVIALSLCGLSKKSNDILCSIAEDQNDPMGKNAYGSIQRTAVYYGLSIPVAAKHDEQVAYHCGFALFIKVNDIVIAEF